LKIAKKIQNKKKINYFGGNFKKWQKKVQCFVLSLFWLNGYYASMLKNTECREREIRLNNKEGIELGERSLTCYSLLFNKYEPFNCFNRSYGIFLIVHRWGTWWLPHPRSHLKLDGVCKIRVCFEANIISN
jgi:hypothetical protein